MMSSKKEMLQVKSVSFLSHAVGQQLPTYNTAQNLPQSNKYGQDLSLALKVFHITAENKCISFSCS